MSLSKSEGPTTTSTTIIVESEVESKADSIESYEEKPQEEKTKEAMEIIESKAQVIVDMMKKEPVPTVVVYHHPHHIEMQKSSRQGHVHEHIYAPTGHQTEKIKIKTGQPRHMQRNIRVQR